MQIISKAKYEGLQVNYDLFYKKPKFYRKCQHNLYTQLLHFQFRFFNLKLIKEF